MDGYQGMGNSAMSDRTKAYQQAAQDDLVINTLSRDDMPAILEIEHSCHSSPWSEGIFEDCFKATYRLWAARLNGELAGYAVVTYQYDEAHLLNLCVSPAARGLGIARRLLQYLIAGSAQDGMQLLLLEVRHSNRAAYRLYCSEGFEQIGVRPDYYPAPNGRENARVMTRPCLL